MEEVNVTTIELDGKDYFLLDTLKDNKNTYHFFSCVGDQSDIQVLKDKVEEDDVFYVSLDTESEFDYALSLFYDKFHCNLDSIDAV